MIYKSIYDGPARNHGTSQLSKRYIAVHNTSNDATAEGEASYAKRRTDGISSHYYVDSDSIVQMLDTKLQAWHAGSATGNQRAISYEITGFNSWSRAKWIASVAWDLLAKQIAIDCRAHSITAQQLTTTQMQDGRTTGIVTHNQMRIAWGGTTHTDPGPNFPMDYLLAKVRAELEGDVPLNEDDLVKIQKAVWQKDNAFPAPNGWPQADNPGLAGGTAARDTWTRVSRIEKTMAAVLAAVGGDMVNEQAIVDGVLAGLAGKPADEMAAALRAVLSTEQVAALAEALQTPTA